MDFSHSDLILAWTALFVKDSKEYLVDVLQNNFPNPSSQRLFLRNITTRSSPGDGACSPTDDDTAIAYSPLVPSGQAVCAYEACIVGGLAEMRFFCSIARTFDLTEQHKMTKTFLNKTKSDQIAYSTARNTVLTQTFSIRLDHLLSCSPWKVFLTA